MPSDIPTLIYDLGDMYMQRQRITQLQEIGVSTIGPLVEALNTNNQVTQAGIVEVLQSFGASAVPQMIEALASPSQVVQGAAINVLATVGPPAVPHLVEAMESRSQTVQGGAVNALVIIGLPAVPQLIEAMGSDSQRVQGGSVNALVGIGPPATTQLIVALNDKNMLVSSNAAVAIRQIGPSVVPALREAVEAEPDNVLIKMLLIELDFNQFNTYRSDLVEALGSSDQAVAARAIDAVVCHGESALPLLSDLMGDSDPYKQQNSTNSMIRLSPVSIPVLLDSLSGAHSQVMQQNAVRALAEIGRPAEKQLKAAAYDEDQYTSQNARAALKKKRIRSR